MAPGESAEFSQEYRERAAELRNALRQLVERGLRRRLHVDGNYPRFLYRYVPVDLEQKPHRIRETIVENKLYLGAVSDFNDPFDCRVRTTTHLSPTQQRRYLDNLLKRHNPNLNWKQRRERIRRSLRNLDIREGQSR